MTETPQADTLLTALISGEVSYEGFATLTDEAEREKALHVQQGFPLLHTP